jgi:hypothetical protein
MNTTSASITHETLDDHPAELQFEFGWSSFEDGYEHADLDTDEQRNGWLAAAELQALIDAREDEEWNRGGQW